MKIASLLLALGIAVQLAAAGHPKIAKDLDDADPTQPVDVIIRYHVTPGDAHGRKLMDNGATIRQSLGVIKPPPPPYRPISSKRWLTMPTSHSSPATATSPSPSTIRFQPSAPASPTPTATPAKALA